MDFWSFSTQLPSNFLKVKSTATAHRNLHARCLRSQPLFSSYCRSTDINIGLTPASAGQRKFNIQRTHLCFMPPVTMWSALNLVVLRPIKMSVLERESQTLAVTLKSTGSQAVQPLMSLASNAFLSQNARQSRQPVAASLAAENSVGCPLPDVATSPVLLQKGSSLCGILSGVSL